MKTKTLAVPFIILLVILNLTAQDTSRTNENSAAIKSLYDLISDVTISGQWFFGYQNRRIDGVEENEFLLKRGYLTIEKKFSNSVSGRITQDISVDHEGDGEGDVEIRLKYGYVRYKFGDISFFHNSYVEFGLVHRPWIDFEQKVNHYRVQGTMYLDRNNVLSSADYGVTITTLFGGEINKEYKAKVSSAYPGKYGSATFGVYNGGGYHAIENNNNKIFEGRISIRPFPAYCPGLQVSYVNLFGKGNVESSPDFKLNMFGLSYESTFTNIMASFMNGKGNQSGKLVDDLGKSYGTSGYSLFAEVKIFGPFAVIGRYDFLEYSDFERKNYISGIAYKFLGGNKILLDYDLAQTNENNYKDDFIAELAVELEF